jgi:hypothetical protein
MRDKDNPGIAATAADEFKIDRETTLLFSVIPNPVINPTP